MVKVTKFEANRYFKPDTNEFSYAVRDYQKAPHALVNIALLPSDFIEIYRNIGEIDAKVHIGFNFEIIQITPELEIGELTITEFSEKF